MTLLELGLGIRLESGLTATAAAAAAVPTIGLLCFRVRCLSGITSSPYRSRNSGRCVLQLGSVGWLFMGSDHASASSAARPAVVRTRQTHALASVRRSGSGRSQMQSLLMAANLSRKRIQPLHPPPHDRSLFSPASFCVGCTECVLLNLVTRRRQ